MRAIPVLASDHRVSGARWPRRVVLQHLNALRPQSLSPLRISVHGLLSIASSFPSVISLLSARIQAESQSVLLVDFANRGQTTLKSGYSFVHPDKIVNRKAQASRLARIVAGKLFQKKELVCCLLRAWILVRPCFRPLRAHPLIRPEGASRFSRKQKPPTLAR